MRRDASELVGQRSDLLRYVGRRVDDPALRDDIVQEAYLRLLAYQARRDGGIGNVAAFLRRIALNLSRDHFRRSARAATTEIPDDLACPQSDVARLAEHRQMVRILCDVLARMPRQRREIFIARRVDGFTAREVAERRGLTAAAVDAHVARAVVDISVAMDALEQGGRQGHG